MTESFVPAAGVASLTGAYDAVIALTMRERKLRDGVIAAVEQSLEGVKSPRIVEIGCGTGSLTTALAKAMPDADATGIDIDPQALAIAQRKPGAAGVRWLEGSATQLPLTPRSADAVAISLVLHHLKPVQQEIALAQAFELLEPGGTLHVVDWGVPHAPLPRAGFPLLQAIDGRENTDPLGKGMLPQLVAAAGFESVRLLHRLGTVWGTVEQLCGRRPVAVTAD